MAEAKRKSIGKTLRFKIFERDSFCCQYCGRKPPETVLEIDHVIPVSKGGGNEDINLLTSCFDCNRGKRDGILNKSPLSHVEMVDKIKSANKQYKEIRKVIEEQKRIQESMIDRVGEVFTAYYPKWVFSERFKSSVKNFIKLLGEDEVVLSMETACIKMRRSEDSLQYFCGICWNKIKNK